MHIKLFSLQRNEEKMKYSIMLAAFYLLMSAQSQAIAETGGGKALTGYQCYTVDAARLHLTQDDYFSGRLFPAIHEDPTPDAKIVGRVPAIFYVNWPLKTENGFVEILYRTDHQGWVEKSGIRPLRKADGSPGGCKLWWGKDGRIMFALDPGVSIRNH
jgi:hypothetical protein